MFAIDKNRPIACFDVYYHENHAQAGCLVFSVKPYERIISSYKETVGTVSDYIPGEFYKRELPCILAVYKKIQEKIGLAIVDGFVSLGHGKKGLGGYLFDVLDKKIPVIGVAKTFFMGCADYVEVYRGISKNPLYVSSMGIGLEHAAKFVENLAGKNRLPDVLIKVDQLSRSHLDR